MSRHGDITFVWGDGEHTFRLAIGQLRELQEKTKAGPLELLARLDNGLWRVDDAREVLRLGLIGGGMTPVAAYEVVAKYADARPFAESIVPAKLILAAALYGTDEEDIPGKEGAAEATTTDGSVSPLSMAGEPSSGSPLDRSIN